MTRFSWLHFMATIGLTSKLQYGAVVCFSVHGCRPPKGPCACLWLAGLPKQNASPQVYPPASRWSTFAALPGGRRGGRCLPLPPPGQLPGLSECPARRSSEWPRGSPANKSARDCTDMKFHPFLLTISPPQHPSTPQTPGSGSMYRHIKEIPLAHIDKHNTPHI